MASRTRCLVVDDSALYRKIIRDALNSLPGVEVVGVAADGQAALAQIEALKPSVVTLDLEMPKLDGKGVLRELAKRSLDVAAIMVSAFTAHGAKSTTEALGLGAFDFILKPTTNSREESMEQLRRDLGPKIRASTLRSRPPAAAPVAAPARPARKPPQRKRLPGVRPQVLGIAVSTGGPKALTSLLPQLPASFPAPVLVVQHMPPMFTQSLAEDLDRRCKLKVSEASQGQPVRRGEILIAPGGYQMRVADLATGRVVQLTDDPPERNCKPSADFLFRSIASVYGQHALGVVLTGMGDDGTAGAKALHKAGASIFAQDEATCTVYGMPKSIVDEGLADVVAPLGKMADHINAAMAGRVTV